MSQSSAKTLVWKARQEMMDKKKQLLTEQIQLFEHDFAYLCSSLYSLKNMSSNYLRGLLQLNIPEEFNKEFAKSRTMTTTLQDCLSVFKDMIEDDFIKNILCDNLNPKNGEVPAALLRTAYSPEIEVKQNVLVGCEGNDVQLHSLKKKLIQDSSTFSEQPFSSGFIDGIIPLAVSPWMFYFQPLALIPQLESMQDGLNAYMKKMNVGNAKTDYRLSSLVAAQFHADQMWYRAKIVSIAKRDGGAEYEVFFLDYGNSEILPSALLHDLPIEFTELPGLAICCSIDNVSPPSGDSCVWSSKSVRDFNSLISRLRFYETVTIRPLSAVDALIFVNLYKKSSKIKQNHEGNLDITQELKRLESVKVVQSNRNAVNSFKYLCFSEDEKRKFRGEMFIKKIEIFNSPEILKKQNDKNLIENLKGKNDYSYPEVVLVKSVESPLNSEKEKPKNQQDYKSDQSSESPANCEKPTCGNRNNSKPIVNDTTTFAANECEGSDLCKVENENIDSKDLIIFSETVSLMESHLSYSTNNCGPCHEEQMPNQVDVCASQSLKELVMLPFQEAECNCVENQSKTEENMHFKYKTISVTDNEFEVHISHVDSPSQFWVLCGEDGQARLTKLNQDMNDHSKCFEGIEKLQPGKIGIGTVCLVILKDSIFGDQLKYRSLVTNVFESEGNCEVEVLLVDYGRTKMLDSNDDIFQLPEYFIKSYPVMSMVCKLEGIEPKDGLWSQEAVEYFKDEVRDAKLHAYFGLQYSLGEVICCHVNKPLEIDLRLARSDDTEESFITLLSSMDYARLSVKVIHEDESFEEVRKSGTLSVNDDKEDVLENFLKDEVDDEFLSVRNSYVVATEAPGVTAANSKTKKYEKEPCKFFNRKKGCWYKESCRFAHVRESDEVLSKENVLVYSLPSTESELDLPGEGSWVFVQISAFVDPQNCFVIFPFGVEQTTSTNSLSSPLDELMMALNEHFNLIALPDHDLTFFSRGEMVVARSIEFELWHRALIVDYDDVDHYKVYLVDYGNTETLPPCRIRSMQPRFMHLPHQASKSSSPISPSHHNWTQDALEFFKSLVEGKVLLAKVLQGLPCGTLLLDLFCSDERKEKNISKIMVQQGYAVHSAVKKCA